MSKIISVSLAAAISLAALSGAQAAIVDFTDRALFSGNPGNTTATLLASENSDLNSDLTVALSSTRGTINFAQPFDGARPAGSPLALDSDGLGIGDNEITGTSSSASRNEVLTVMFDRVVRIEQLFFLDLFRSAVDQSFERAYVDLDGNGSFETTYGAAETVGGGNPGYLAASDFLPVSTRLLRFTTFGNAALNDDVGRPDFALAGIGVSEVPLPAGAVLLLTGLAGLGAARRRSTRG